MKMSTYFGKSSFGRLSWVVLAVLLTACSADDPVDETIPDTDIPNENPTAFSIEEGGDSFKVPFFSNYDLTEPNESIERVVLVFHGTGRTAESYFQAMASAANNASAAENTLIIAPRFMLEDDIEASNYGDGYLYWTNSGWKEGDYSAGSSGNSQAVISSYRITDEIISQLIERSNFPNLKNIVLAGHSAGGQYLNRYAAATQIHTLTDEKGIALKYVVANPSSYLYLNKERRVEGYEDLFRAPSNPACGDYNEYKYGIEKLNPYMAESGAELIREQYKERKVVYLLGEDDKDPNSSGLDTDCAAMMQGSNRLERGKIYFNYLQHFYGSSITENHAFKIVRGAGHDKARMFDSREGRAVIFQD